MIHVPSEPAQASRSPLAHLLALPIRWMAMLGGERQPLPEGYYRPHSRRTRKGGH